MDFLSLAGGTRAAVVSRKDFLWATAVLQKYLKKILLAPLLDMEEKPVGDGAFSRGFTSLLSPKFRPGVARVRYM